MEQHRKHEKQKRAAIVIIQNYVRKWLVRRTYLKSLSGSMSIPVLLGVSVNKKRILKAKTTGV
jgi:hypothetical protein